MKRVSNLLVHLQKIHVFYYTFINHFLRRRKMKRLMTIIFVMAMVKVANAGMVDTLITYLNGQPIAPTKEITVMPSDEVGLGIIYTSSPDRTLFLLSVDMFASVPGLGT